MKVLLVLLLLCFLPLWGTTGKTPQTPDEKLMRLSLDVMLYNKDLNHALEIAQTGVRRFPHKIYWLEQAAKIAQWLGKPDIAKKYYIKLLEKSGDQKYAMKVETLSQATYDLRTLVDLYEKLLAKTYNEATVEKLCKLYNDLGYLERGYAFLKENQKKYPAKLLSKKAILLAFSFQNPEEIGKAYTRFTKHYGTDNELLFHYAKLLFSQKKYARALHILKPHEKSFCPKDTKLCNLYANLAYIMRKETILFDTLSKMYQNHILTHEKEMLFFKLLEKKSPSEALALLLTSYQKHHTSQLFYKAIYLTLQTKDFQTLQKLLNNLTPKEQKSYALSWQYWILRAQTAQYFQDPDDTLASYRQALTLAPENSNVHENYLWFLIDNKETKSLQKELWILEKMPSIQNSILFPVTLGYFTLQQGIPAKYHMESLLLQQPKNWQFYLLYADILTLCGEKEGASFYMHKAWKMAQKEHRTKDFCNTDRNKCYDYIRLGIYFRPLLAQKYLREGKSILKPSVSKDLHTLFLQQLGYAGKTAGKVQNSYTKAYENRLFNAMQSNPQNDTFANNFANHIAQKGNYFKAESSRSKRARLKIDNLYVSYRKSISQNSYLILKACSQKFKSSHKKENIKRDETSLTLNRSLKNKTFKFQVGIGHDTKQYTFMKTSLGYSKEHLSLHSSLSYHERDDTTTDMLLHGYKNRMTVDISYKINHHDTVSLNMHTSAYYLQNFKSYGTFTQLQYTHYLHFAYPDIYTRFFTSFQHYDDKKKKLPQDFWQTGINAGIGMQAKEKFRRTWHPYTNATLLYNSQTQTGYSLVLGAGKRLLQHDYFGIELYYANGIGEYQEEYFSVKAQYLLW